MLKNINQNFSVMKDKIKKWLSDDKRSYTAGVEIFKTCEVDKSSETFFNVKEPTTLHKNMLFTKISEWYRVNANNLTKQTTTAIADDSTDEILRKTSTIIKSKKVDYDKLPKELQKAYDEIGEMYSEMRSLHAELKHIPADKKSDKKRKTIVNKIVGISKSVKTNWIKIDDWIESNKEE